MKTAKIPHRLSLAALLAIGLCALPVGAQTPATAVPATAPATAVPAAAAPAAAPVATTAEPRPARPIPRKRRSANTSAAMGCEPVKDPWENICTIRKHAELACSDLAAPAAKPARKARKGAPPPVAERNLRQECIDAYMRNV